MNRQERRAQEKKKSAGGCSSQLATAENLLTRGHLDQAANIYREVLARESAQATALYNLGMIRHKQERLAEAGDVLGKLCAQAPADAAAHIALAYVRMDQGRMEEALGISKQVATAALHPRQIVKLGILYREAGRTEEAKALFSRAIGLQPDMIDAYYSLRTLKKFTADDPDFQRLQKIAQREESLAADDKIKLNFTLARALQDQGKTDEAFARYTVANRLKKSTYKTPVSRFEDYAENITQIFTADLVNKLQGKSAAVSQRPIFIVGMPRSGSTLVDQILSSHPGAASIGESKSFPTSIPAYPNKEIPGFFGEGKPSVTQPLLDSLTPEALTKIGEKYLALTEDAAGGGKPLVDKMLFNFYWVGLIRLALPQAKIIHCTRHPCDIGLSIWQLMFNEAMPWAYDLEDIGRYYLAYEKIMAHWKKLFPDAIHEVNYETMIENQEGETRKLLAFCGLPWDDACLKFHDSARQVKTASALQVRVPIYKTSAGKWAFYKDYLSPLIAVLEQEKK